MAIDYDTWLIGEDTQDFYDPTDEEVWNYWLKNYDSEIDEAKDLIRLKIGLESFKKIIINSQNYINDYDRGIVEDEEDWIRTDPNKNATKLWNKIRPTDVHSLYDFLQIGDEYDALIERCVNDLFSKDREY